MTQIEDAIPIFVITGSLGSGKSTLLNALLRSGQLPNAAVIVNEFGEIGIDHALIETVREGIALLNSGCICCSPRTDLELTLQDLLVKRLRGIIPDFSAVLIETTGLADPGPVIQTLLARPIREMRYRLASVVTTVDLINGSKALSSRPEAVRQVAAADRLVLTKSDICDERDAMRLEAQLVTINPLAPTSRPGLGRYDPREVLGEEFFAAGNNVSHASRWLQTIRSVRSAPELRKDRFIGASDAGLAHMRRHRSGDQYHHGVAAYSYIIEPPLDWDKFAASMKTLTERYGSSLLRIKALLQIAGLDKPVAFHGAHHLLHPPDILEGWPDSERCSRIVVIVDRLDRACIDQVMESLRV